ncbi:MAG: methyltransferase domain-containing protein, partial [Phycisphaerales bacterium]
FDPFYKGGWQSRYAEMIDRAFGLRGKSMLDVGCAAGALASAFTDRGAGITGVDICRYFIEASPFENVRGQLQVTPAWNLPFPDNAFDLIHCSQVLEHVPEEKQCEVFAELRRVLRPDGLLFAAMPMGEDHEDEWDDVTHTCLHDFGFWKGLAENAGFGHVTSRWEPLHGHPMYREYQWSYLVATRVHEHRVSGGSPHTQAGHWIIAHWGDNKRHVFDPVVRALESSGHSCRWIQRDDTNARPELIAAIRSDDYDGLLTWQRIYPMQHDLLDAVEESTLRTVFMDYGFHPHYHSVVFDSCGENATSSLAASWGDQDRYPASDAAFCKVEEMLQAHAHRAVEVREHPPHDVTHIERPFVFVPLQRPTDSVVRFDSEVHDFGVLGRRVLALAAHRYFVVIKPHPLDRDLDLGVPDFSAGHHLVLRRTFHGDNEAVNDWLLSQAALVVGVNSNMLFRAALYGTPTIACGRGWFSGSGAIVESLADPNLCCLRVRSVEPSRRREYLAACLDRQLTFEELSDSSKVISVLTRIGVLSAPTTSEVIG